MTLTVLDSEDTWEWPTLLTDEELDALIDDLILSLRAHEDVPD